MAALKLEDLLKDLADDGVRDSSGSFTLDPSKAEEKLRGFSFASPHHYLLKLVQCAVAGGARVVNIDTGASEIRIEFDGAVMEASDVESMIGYLLSEHAPISGRRFRHLAAALRGAEALKPEAVIFDFSTGTSRIRRVWDKEGWRQTASPDGSERGPHVFLLDRTFRQTMTAAKDELVSAFGSNDTAEEAVLRARCRYSDCQVRLDGERVGAWEFGEARYPGYDIASDPNPGEALPPLYIREGLVRDGFMVDDHHLVEKIFEADDEHPGNLPLPPSCATLPLQRPEKGPCFAWLAVTAELGKPKVVFVEDGVVLSEEEPSDIELPGFVAVVSGLGMAKDLTGFQLVREQRFQAFRGWMQKEAAQMKEALLMNMALFPNRDRIRKALT